MKSIGRKIISGVVIALLVLTSVIPAFAAGESLAETFTDEVFDLRSKDQLVDLLELYDSLENENTVEDLTAAYTVAIGALAGAQQDRVEEFGVTLDAVQVFVQFVENEDYDMNNLINYIEDNDQASFKAAIEARQGAFETALGNKGVDVASLKAGFAKIDKVFYLIAGLENTRDDNGGELGLLTAQEQYGDLALDEDTADIVILIANMQLTDEIDSPEYVIDAMNELVDFYNALNNENDKRAVYDYLNNIGLISVAADDDDEDDDDDSPGGGGGGGGTTPDPDEDEESEADDVSNNADNAQTEDDASSVVNDSSEAAESTSEAAASAETQEEKQAVKEDTQKILDSVTKVTDLIATPEKAKEAAQTITKTLSSVGKIIETLNDEASSKELADKASETVDKASNLIDKVEDVDDKIEVAKNLITGIKSIKDAAKDAGESIEKKAVDIVNKAVESAGKAKADDVKEEAGKATAKINKDSITAAIQNVKKVKETLEGELTSNGIESNKKVKSKVTVEVASSEDVKEVETELPSLKDVFEDVDSVEVKSSVADFGIGKDTLPEEAKDGDIKLSAKSVDDAAVRSKLPPDTPADAPVIDLNLSVKKGEQEEKVSKFNKPIEVSVKVKVDNPEDGEYVSVFLLKDDGTIEKVGGKYDAKTGKVKFKTNHFSIYFAKVAKESFNDIANFDWAQKGITVLAGKGIINGKGEGAFDPDNTVTRAEFVSMIVRMLKIDSEAAAAFSDVSEEAWYADAVAAATSAGIINGRAADTFAPNETITRQEISKIVAKVLESEGYNIPANMKKIAKLEDNNDIAGWAKEYVELAYREGIINGRTQTTFVPEANATRAEAAVMIYRLFNLI